MKKIIDETLSNINQFTDTWANSDLSSFSFDTIVLPPAIKVFGDGIETATLIIGDVKQYSSISQAFIITLKKYIYHCEEWKDNYSNDTSKDDWMKYLQNHWLPEYIRLPQLEEMPADDFINRMNSELIRLKINNEYMSSIQNKLTNLKVMILNKGLMSYDAFCITDYLCFIYSWWIGY